jgi:hypothetical protein
LPTPGSTTPSSDVNMLAVMVAISGLLIRRVVVPVVETILAAGTHRASNPPWREPQPSSPTAPRSRGT